MKFISVSSSGPRCPYLAHPGQHSSDVCRRERYSILIQVLVKSFMVASTFRTDQGDRRVAGLSFLHVKISFCADGGKDFGML